MAAESIIVIIGDDSPDDVIEEVLSALDTCNVVSFSWDNEDNEDMPATAAYLAEKYNTYGCALMYAGSKTRDSFPLKVDEE